MKPIFFRFSADDVHHGIAQLGERMGEIPFMRSLQHTVLAYNHPILEQDLLGTHFANPIGLAAGFDHEGKLTQVLPSVGFGFETVGTVTFGAYAGNTPPMFGRLPRSQSLWVNKGFQSSGAKNVHQHLASQTIAYPYGISIGATNRKYASVEDQITEYERAFRVFLDAPVGNAYYELNISCPNLMSAFDFKEPQHFRLLAARISKLKSPLPILVKMPIDIDPKTFRELLDIILENRLTGIVVGNLTKDHSNPALWQSEAKRFTGGGFSGKPTQARSDLLIRVARQHAGNKLVIVGCGGVFSAHDAYRKIRNGATLIQMITGLIYQGPQVVGEINHDLAALLQADGFKSISEAVGVEV